MHDTIEQRLRGALAVDHLDIVLDGNRCSIAIASDDFEGLNPVRRQQLVYQHIGDFISSGEIHAVTINAMTAAQWLERDS